MQNVSPFTNTSGMGLDAVKSVMMESDIIREATRELNEELGIQSRDALPWDIREAYDETLAQRIDELSKGTLTSYVKKASADSNKASREIDWNRKRRYRGLSTRPYQPHVKAMKQGIARKAKRDSGIEKALGKLGEEQIDELSKKTLSDYMTGASPDVKKSNDQNPSKWSKKTSNRVSGYRKALKKVYGEESVVDEAASYDPYKAKGGPWKVPGGMADAEKRRKEAEDKKHSNAMKSLDRMGYGSRRTRNESTVNEVNGGLSKAKGGPWKAPGSMVDAEKRRKAEADKKHSNAMKSLDRMGYGSRRTRNESKLIGSDPFLNLTPAQQRRFIALQKEKQFKDSLSKAWAGYQANQKLRKGADKPIKEDEQLDELSKKTLGSYIRKAYRQQKGQQYDVGFGDGGSDRRGGGSTETKKQGRRYVKRDQGIDRATKRMEEETQISETLSPGTLVTVKSGSHRYYGGKTGRVVSPGMNGTVTVRMQDGKTVGMYESQLTTEGTQIRG